MGQTPARLPPLEVEHGALLCPDERHGEGLVGQGHEPVRVLRPGHLRAESEEQVPRVRVVH